VEIEPGLDGLVHVSRMALDRRVVHPRDVVAIGDEVEVSVISLDIKERRIGLSLVEAAQQEAAAQEREAMAAVQASEPQSLGTLGDLLAKSAKPKG
jgi:ribosomal protein S1